MSEEYLKRLPELDPANKKTIKAYIRKQELKQLQPSSIQDKTWRVYYLLKFLNWKDAREITKTDLEDYIIERRKTVAPRTLQGDMIELRIFFRFLDSAKEKEFFPADEKMQKPKIEYPDPLTRDEIQRLVDACDWTQIPDVPLDDEQRKAWQTYRQALRDIPQQLGDGKPANPDEVVWPEKPESP